MPINEFASNLFKMKIILILTICVLLHCNNNLGKILPEHNSSSNIRNDTRKFCILMLLLETNFLLLTVDKIIKSGTSEHELCDLTRTGNRMF